MDGRSRLMSSSMSVKPRPTGAGYHGVGGSQAELRARVCYEHPAPNLFRKQLKSWTLSTGGVVDASQLAAAMPRANWFRKQLKSCTLRMGGVVELSQLA